MLRDGTARGDAEGRIAAVQDALQAFTGEGSPSDDLTVVCLAMSAPTEEDAGEG